ncbi:unnamed protein product [Ilex paraguariensis]|uniref:ARM repeat N-terminal plant domain-containing protein n=1 Tax=Ilex paraguariensis TaxID=185542 RepID=A0ABC8SES6_9AQUA
MPTDQTCTDPSCFFCLMKEPDPSIRRPEITNYFKKKALFDDQELVLVLSGLWNIAMTQPDDPELPSLGIFECMASLISKSINNRAWLLRNQNIYIPYYAAHVIGSYTMNKVEFAEKAVESGVITPLMELLRGKMSWVEQRVAVRALGHLASYEKTFGAVAEYEDEVVKLAMNLASTCLEEVYVKFVGVKDTNKRLKYHRDLLTRGIGGLETENRKAEEWASQLQCWSLHILNCFAIKERSLGLICKQEFLKDLCEMWGGLMNQTSPAGVGLVRILCYSKVGRKSIADSQKLAENLCNLSRSSDDWQYMGIDCLLLLLNDPDTRYKVIEIATLYLIDLIDLRALGGRSNVGETITRTLLSDFKQRESKIKNSKVRRALEDIWGLMVDRREKEHAISEEKLQEKRVMVSLIKQQGNHSFWVGEIKEAILKFTEALELCPLTFRKQRIVLYSNRAQCHLLLRDPDAAITDTTRALCLSNPPNCHGKSLWRRSQAYDMKGLGKESLMDCLMFINGCIKSGGTSKSKHMKIPYYAVRMINKQVDSTWIFTAARSKSHAKKLQQSHGGGDQYLNDQMLRMIIENKGFMSGLSTILEESLIAEGGSHRRKMDKARGRKKAVLARST